MNVIDQIKTLSPTETVMAMEALWEQLRSGERHEPESLDWPRDELRRRDDKIQAGEAEFYAWDEAKNAFAKASIDEY